MRKRWWWIAPVAIVAIPLFIFIGGEVVMHLWNWLLPPLFGWKTLEFWQAAGAAGVVPGSIRRPWRPRPRSQTPLAGPLPEDEPGGAGEIPPRDGRRIQLRHIG